MSKEAAKAFFSAPYFAVVGASNDPKKFGHKREERRCVRGGVIEEKRADVGEIMLSEDCVLQTVFTWYTHHNLPVTPINPFAPSIETRSPYPARKVQSYATVPSLSALPHPTETSVSFVTAPKVTMEVLQEAKKLGIQGVWLQPGSFDDEALKFALKEFKAGVGGTDSGEAGGEGWCVLVDGEEAARTAGIHKL
ncbi:hypothetical protein EG329_004681 [Mollisiaceae sp. DMI_Dod_QoI]|nr:hypothetical protein EG329_004681 [Helotiales sp. DMI_Dod_QoI]